MGATPILGLAIAEFPTDVLPLEVLQEILRGGADKAAEAGFPIVALGASAGGLEAFEEFFRHVPPDCGMAVVLVSHLDPDRVSPSPGEHSPGAVQNSTDAFVDTRHDGG